MNEKLQVELRSQAASPPLGDVHIEAFCQAMLKLLAKPGLEMLKKELNRIAEHNPSYAVNKALRIFQKHLIGRTDYPHVFTDYIRWTEELDQLCLDKIVGVEIMNDLMYNDVQSNVVERYKAFKLIIQLFGEYVGASPRLLDVGCSRNHGLKKLKLNLPFQKITCGLPEDSFQPGTILNSCFNRLLQEDLKLSDATGSDIVGLNDYGAKQWAKSCSFYPSELKDGVRVAEYEFLDTQEVTGVAFERGDFTAGGIGSVLGRRSFDIITVSTFLYQLPVYERYYVQKLLRSYLSPKGMIIYQDFVSAHGSSMRFETEWFNLIYPYRTLVEFADDHDHNIYELIRWENGRCSSWVPGKDLTNILQRKSNLYTPQ